VGWDSSVGIVTGYGMDGPGDRIPVGARFSSTVLTGPGGPPNHLYNGNQVFPGSKERPGPDADPSPPSTAVVKKEYSYTSTLLMGRTAYTEPQCLTRVHFTYFYLIT